MSSTPLEVLAAMLDCDPCDAIDQAVVNEHYLRTEMAKGAILLFEDPDGSFRKITLGVPA